MTGAAGFVGSHLVEALASQGTRVRCLVRASSSRDWIDHLGADVTTVSFEDPDSIRSAVAGVDVVYHVAGIIRAVRADDYYRTNVLGTRAVAQACAAAIPRPRRLVLVSSQAAAGPAPAARPARESDAPRPVSAYGRSKRAAESEVLAVSDRLEVTIVRPSVVYGPRDRAVLPLFRLVRWRVVPRLSLDPAVSLIHVRDLARCLELAGRHPSAAGRCYFATGRCPHTLSELLRLVAEALGCRPAWVPVPSAVLVAAGAGVDVLSRVTGRPRTFGVQKAREMLKGGWVCSAELARTDLGFAAEIEPRVGLAETGDWYRRHGWL